MPELLMSEDVAATLNGCDRRLRSQVARRVERLTADPTHPGLQVHRIVSHADKWECYINRNYRLIFDRNRDVIRLWKLGPHSMIDRVQYATFPAHTAFRRVDSGDELAAARLADEPYSIWQRIEAVRWTVLTIWKWLRWRS